MEKDFDKQPIDELIANDNQDVSNYNNSTSFIKNNQYSNQIQKEYTPPENSWNSQRIRTNKIEKSRNYGTDYLINESLKGITIGIDKIADRFKLTNDNKTSKVSTECYVGAWIWFILLLIIDISLLNKIIFFAFLPIQAISAYYMIIYNVQNPKVDTIADIYKQCRNNIVDSIANDSTQVIKTIETNNDNSLSLNIKDYKQAIQENINNEILDSELNHRINGILNILPNGAHNGLIVATKSSENINEKQLYRNVLKKICDALQASDIDIESEFKAGKFDVIKVECFGYNYTVYLVTSGKITKRLTDTMVKEKIGVQFKSQNGRIQTGKKEIINVDVKQTSNNTCITIQSSETKPIFLKDLLKDVEAINSMSKFKLKALIGSNMEGNPIIADYADRKHNIILGETGSGKSWYTVYLINMLCSLNSPELLNFYILDPKHDPQLEMLTEYPHVRGYETDINKFKDIIEGGYKEHKHRANEIFPSMVSVKTENRTYGVTDIQAYNKKAEKKKIKPVPYIIVVFDEIVSTMNTLKLNNKDMYDELRVSITNVAVETRSSGVYLMLIGQRTKDDIIPTTAAQQMTTKSIMISQPATIKHVLGDVQPERVPIGQGQCLMVTDGNQEFMQVPVLAEDTDEVLTTTIELTKLWSDFPKDKLSPIELFECKEEYIDLDDFLDMEDEAQEIKDKDFKALINLVTSNGGMQLKDIPYSKEFIDKALKEGLFIEIEGYIMPSSF